MVVPLKERVERTQEITSIPEIERHLSEHWNVNNIPMHGRLSLLIEWFKGYPTDEPQQYVCLKCGKWFNVH